MSSVRSCGVVLLTLQIIISTCPGIWADRLKAAGLENTLGHLIYHRDKHHMHAQIVRRTALLKYQRRVISDFNREVGDEGF